MIAIFISMTLFALIGAMSPGPVNIIAASTGANYGFQKALPHVVGATISYTLIVFLMGISLNQTLAFFPQFTYTLKYFGGAFLLYMAYKIATASPFETSDLTQNNIKKNGANKDDIEPKPPSFIEGMLSQGLNPKAWLVSMSGVSLFVLPNTPAYVYISAFTIVSFIICFFGVGTWAAIGQLIGRFLSTEKRQKVFNIVMGLLLASTVVSILISK